MTRNDTINHVIIPCLYNSFSFTPENNAIVYYDCYRRRVLEPPTHIPVLEPLPEPRRDSSPSPSPSPSPLLSPSSEPEVSFVPETVFHPDMMSRYAYAPNKEIPDSLLCLSYIMINGSEKYETIENHYIESNRFKFELIETLRTCKPILKANKIRISEVEETLVHKPFMNLETLRAVAVCKGLSVCIVQDRKYFRCDNGAGAGAGSFILEKIKGKYVLYLAPGDLREKYLNFIYQNYWQMESISAPIRPISAYKLPDLVDISTRLGLPIAYIIPGKFGSMGTEKRKTKPELYEAIKLKVYL